jgi:NADH-quinone oxidoreductase subunit M
MMLVVLILVLMSGGLLAWISNRWNREAPKWISLLSLVVDFFIVTVYWLRHYSIGDIFDGGWLVTFRAVWIESFGISVNLAMDGLSLLMLVLTFFLGIMAVLVSWKEIEQKVGFYYFNLLWVLAGITGVFITLDLFLFYFFWEVMLIPMYFLIGIWGHENKRYAAYKFFIFTQAGGLLMLLSILGLYFVHGQTTGNYTFDYLQLLGTNLDPSAARWLMLGFLVAFIVKLPVVPFHTWLPDAHSQAPTAGSLILAGLLLKTGAYGILRFVIPLFPGAASEIAGIAMLLGVIGILYGAVLAYGQTDFKRLVAYTSVSHMGFVMLGAFAFNKLALQGVIMQMITHGISTGALFILAGCIYERIHTRDVSKMGGFWPKMPRMGGIALVFVMASLGLPGLGNFIAEFLTLVGSWQVRPVLTILAATGLVGATAYSLRIMQRIFYGDPVPTGSHPLHDMTVREKFILIPMVVVIIALGVYPAPVLHTANAPISNVLNYKPAEEPVATTSIEVKQGGIHEQE